MTNLPKIFMYQGTQIRMVVKDNEPWWVAKDVTDVLDIDASQVRRLDDDEKGLCSIQTLGGNQEMVCVNEPGLYALILGSKKPEAKPFKRWVTHKVLPEIRKTGSFNVQQQFTLPQNYVEALKALVATEEEKAVLVEQNANKEQQLRLQEPKVALYDVAMSADGVQPVGTVAKELGLGRTRLFALLREKKILRQNNEPYQEYIERGYFKLRMYTITHMTSGLENKTQPMVTPKGIAWLHKIIKGA